MKTIFVDAVDAFVIPQNDSYIIYEDMHALLETFSNKKILLTGATKNDGFKKYGLDKMPYDVFTLEHNPEKADPKYYEILLERLDLDKNDVVYFEHNPIAVKSAQSVGIETYFYDEQKKDLGALQSFLMAHASESGSAAVGELEDFKF